MNKFINEPKQLFPQKAYFVLKINFKFLRTKMTTAIKEINKFIKDIGGKR